MIIVEHKNALVILVALATDTSVTGAQVAVANVFRKRGGKAFTDGFAMPGAILPMRGHNNPLLTQRMPSLFPPGSACAHRTSFVSSTQRIVFWSGIVNALR